jgi:RimJ/RimL family protein N-acetyltransferase
MSDTPGAPVELETVRLRIRRMTEADAPFIVDLLNDPAFLRFIGDKKVRTLEDARRYIVEGPIASYARFGFGLDVVTLKADDTPIGICGLLKREQLPDPDIGFAYLAAYCGVGYGREAAEACLSRAPARILAITSPDNQASIRLLEKLGFRFERLTALSEGAPEVKLFVRTTIPPS